MSSYTVYRFLFFQYFCVVLNVSHLLSKRRNSRCKVKGTSKIHLEMSQRSTPSPAIIGPALPPSLLESRSKFEESSENECSSNAFSSHGPNLSSHLKNQNILNETNNEKFSYSQTFSSEPSEQTNNATPDAYGPALPVHLLKLTTTNDLSRNDNSDDDDDDVYGPLPPELTPNSSAHRSLEERALELKLNGNLANSDKHKSKIRDEWMLQLPGVGCGGLGTRHFRKNDRPDFTDRSIWTNTPKSSGVKDRPKELDVKEETRQREVERRDREQRKMAERYKRKHGDRGDSLLEMHQKKIKKQKKKEEQEAKSQGLSSARRPFNREVDLKVNMFDEAQKRSIVKKAMHLDDRFSKGQSSYL